MRQGSQLPSIESYPLFHTTAADDAVDIAAVAGLVLDPWQEHVLRGSLGEKRDGKWAATQVGLVVPRQNGKNALLEAREIAGLFLFGERLIIHTAHEMATARESMLALQARLLDTPELMEQVKGFDGDPDKDFAGMKTGNDPGITLKNGNRLSYRARSKGSGRGFSGDLVVADEAYALKSAEIAALFPTMAAKSMAGNYQVWFTSSAGMPESDFLADLRKKGMQRSSPRLAYFEWSAEEDAASDDIEAWYAANPGLGLRISPEFIQDEMGLLGDEEFRRERLGIWAPLKSSAGAFPLGVWASNVVADDVTIAGKPVVALDVRTGLQQSAAIVAAGSTREGYDLIHVVRFEPDSGQRIVDEALTVLRSRGLDSIVIDKYGENASLFKAFEDEGIRVVALNTMDMRAGATAMQDALINGRLKHKNQAPLNNAVLGAGKQVNDAGFRWSQLKSTSDITALRAATAAWWVHHSQAQPDYDILLSTY